MKFIKKIFNKKIIISLIIIVLLSAVSIFVADGIIQSHSSDFLYSDVEKIPENKVALVLGTSKYLRHGIINHYYEYRIDAALALWKAGKVKFFVISGDNSRKDYNEPEQMKADLMEGGVSPDAIFLDYAGFRTWDSLVRMNKIFGQNSFTIVSQKFHNERAVFIARQYDYNVVAFNAKDVDKYYGFKTNIREKFARVKVFVDCLFNKQPKFLGEEIEIK